MSLTGCLRLGLQSRKTLLCTPSWSVDFSNALDGSQDDLVSSDIPNIEEKMRKVKVQSLLRKRMLMALESHLAMKIPLVMMNIKFFFCDVLYSTCYYAIMTLVLPYLVWSVVNMPVVCGKTLDCTGQ